MYNWRKNIASWQISKTLYLSVPFTWMLPEAKRLASLHKGPACAGGPAVDLMPDYLGLPSCKLPYSPLQFHNPMATFTTRGCVNQCKFCAVPKIEGEFQEIENFEVKPVVCDNNFLASSRRHFDRVVDALKVLPYVDFNQGLDARLLTAYQANRLAELNCKVRFSLDHSNLIGKVHDAVQFVQRCGIKDIGIYVLIGFNDTPDDARHRLETVRSWGIRPNPMRYQPLDCLGKNDFVGDNWTRAELSKMTRYYSRLRWLEHIPYDEFNGTDGETLFDLSAMRP